MKVQWNETGIPGLYLSSNARISDERGSFTKILAESGDAAGSAFVAVELLWTMSKRGVIRGVHFQIPPHATRKLVFVVKGCLRDFVVDLRQGSPTMGRLYETELAPGSGALIIPRGCGHAYESLTDETIVCYAQDTFYDEAAYAGIRPDTVGIVPAAASPIYSRRDLEYPTLAEFDSPFSFDA